MFGRRVASSCPIPKAMYTRLGINSAKQAARILPPLVPVSAILSRSICGVTGSLPAMVAGSELCAADLSAPVTLLAALGLTPQTFLGAMNANPLLLRMISDTMCTYSVIKHGLQQQHSTPYAVVSA